MAEESFEYECMRAELLGLEKPNEAEFQMRLKQQLEDSDLLETQMLESQDDALKNTHGKIDEINSILASTQKKINHLKQITSISLSNLFTTDKTTNKKTPVTESKVCSSIPTSTDTLENNLGEITLAKENLQKKDSLNPGMSFAQLEKEKKASAHLDKLDLLITKTERAEISMSEQKKQMRKLIK